MLPTGRGLGLGVVHKFCSKLKFQGCDDAVFSQQDPRDHHQGTGPAAARPQAQGETVASGEGEMELHGLLWAPPTLDESRDSQPWNADSACPSLQRQLDLVLLVPELTFLTGLSDLRKNSRMLKVRTCLISPSHLSQGFVRSPKPSLLGIPRAGRDVGDGPEPPAALPAPHRPPAPHPRHPGGLPGAGALGAGPGHGYLQGKGCRAPSLPSCHGGSGGSSGDSRSAQTQGHILPVERINLRHRSFFPAEDVGWHREVAKEAPITTVSSLLSPSLWFGKLWDGFS